MDKTDFNHMLQALSNTELEEKKKKVAAEMDDIKQRLYLIQEEMDCREQEYCHQFVGKCYKQDTLYVKVLDVPKPAWTMTRKDFNPYQLPALLVDTSMPEFSEAIRFDTVFRREIDPSESDAFFRTCGYVRMEEISLDEFKEAAHAVLDKFLGRALK